MTTYPAADLHAAIAQAEAKALAEHRSGTCAESEFSCSYCEREGNDQPLGGITS